MLRLLAVVLLAATFGGAQTVDPSTLDGKGLLGYPGMVRNYFGRALLRSGIISWVFSTEPDKSAILIDSTVTPGHSGGPAFRVPGGFDRHGSFQVGGLAAFLGIVQTFYQPMDAVFDEKEFGFRSPRGELIQFRSLMALAEIEPAARVKELLTEAAAAQRD